MLTIVNFRRSSKITVVNTALGFRRRNSCVDFSGSAPKRIHTVSFCLAISEQNERVLLIFEITAVRPSLMIEKFNGM